MQPPLSLTPMIVIISPHVNVCSGCLSSLQAKVMAPLNLCLTCDCYAVGCQQ